MVQQVYHLVMTNSSPWKIIMLLIGKPSINEPFSMAMLNNQMVSLGLGSLSLSIGLKSPSTAKMTEVLAAQGEFPGHKPVIFRLKWT